MLRDVYPDWLESRRSTKVKTQAADQSAYRSHIEPKFGQAPIGSITTAQVAQWTGSMVAAGMARSTVTRYLSTLRSLLAFAVADGRLTRNVAAGVKVPAGGRSRREGEFLTLVELRELASACSGRYAETVLVLGLCGLRFGEFAGLQVGDRVSVPGPGLRLQRTVLAESDKGGLYVDTLKGHRARTVALPSEAAEVVARWAAGKPAAAWLFPAPNGGPLGESNWRRSLGWSTALASVGRPTLRPHDLRHTAASIWLAAGADPKVVQRVLGHASAAMTMDLYGHLIDASLWDAARKVGGTTGAPDEDSDTDEAPESDDSGA
ncbi:tyrosine-type recombinase/integrase [Segeticoccus rhizosphaerae]|uniref:tyrosine-type recombinase/integrase n=1 Tax=Segeticoccus rhizosphaerae TaxID=1104777 RepID=UPI001396BE12|nr:tyrosine-type recombinase/integrase [Segeticoccus rhizosphaerae]